MDPVTLYQFELCPFCHKARAGMEIKGIPYTKVEVNPYTKKELPELPEGAPKKVPVLQYNGDTVHDSTAILRFIDERFDRAPDLIPSDEDAAKHALEIEEWVDSDLTQILPAVIYGTWTDATKAAQVTARSSNFGMLQNLMVRAGGSLIMHQVAKRIIAKRGGGDAGKMLATELDRLEQWLGDKPFLGGDEPTIGDIATHGALTCVKEFPAFSNVTERPSLSAWYDRVDRLRKQNRDATSL